MFIDLDMKLNLVNTKLEVWYYLEQSLSRILKFIICLILTLLYVCIKLMPFIILLNLSDTALQKKSILYKEHSNQVLKLTHPNGH